MIENNTEKGTHILSKSTLLRGLQCPKSLYLNKYHPNLRDEISEMQQGIFTRGTEIGELAQNLFPGGINTSPEKPLKIKESVEHTQKLIKEGTKIIYEAAFQFNEVLCLIDILVNENGKWKAYEVKSSTGITDVYIMDASAQYYIITNAGIQLDDIFIVYINNQYIRQGDLDLHSLFAIQSVLEDSKRNQEFVESSIYELKDILKQKEVPEIDIGERCFNPYGCDFQGHCWQHIPENSVFNISRLKKSEAFDLYRQGIVRQEDVPDNYPLGFARRLQVDCYRNNETIIDQEGLRSFLKEISYPLYFMDFETFMPAEPLFDNSRPYQQIPFQYSLHYLEEREAELEHFEYLARAGSDPREEFIEVLLKDTKRPGDILVYSKSFEATRLRELARDFPAFEKAIKERISRIKDLMIPFQKKYFYSPQMKGSYSLKAVLPALVPELSYNDLEISDGGMAMGAFEYLQKETDEKKIREIRRNLLEYCKMDTLAMVRILEKLEKVV